MLRFFLRILLAILAIRILAGFVRLLTGAGARERVGPGRQADSRDTGRAAPREERPLVDRSAAIDVSFTEEAPD